MSMACAGCAAAPGTPHGAECDHAACPDCGEQLIFHDCEHWPADADGPDRPAIWHGVDPQAEVARLLNWWTTAAGIDHPVEDYTRVTIAEGTGQIEWDPQGQRFVIGEIDEAAIDRVLNDPRNRRV